MIPLFWILFNVFVLAMLVLDLGVFHRKCHAVKFREALVWSVVWIALAAVFAVSLYLLARTYRRPLEFVTGYVIELSLSVDNLFVFLLIFRYFRVHRHISTRSCSGGFLARWSCAPSSSWWAWA